MTSFKPGDVVVRIVGDNDDVMTKGTVWIVVKQEERWLYLEDYTHDSLARYFRKATKLEQALR